MLACVPVLLASVGCSAVAATESHTDSLEPTSSDTAPTPAPSSAGTPTTPAAVAAPVAGHALTLDQLTIESGRIHGEGSQLAIAAPEVRATAALTSGDAATLAFTFEGHTAETSKLANGEIRSQVCLKLRASNTCNLMYVCWQENGQINASVKSNAGQSTHAQCGANGYHGFFSTQSTPLTPHAAHTLTAKIIADTLTITADENTYSVELPADAPTSGGVMGMRSDNAAFEFTLTPM